MSYLLIVLQSLIFALIDVLAKVAFQSVEVAGFLTIRFSIAIIGGFILYGKTIVEDIKTVSPKYYLLPALALGLSINLSNVALKYTTATSYAFFRNMAALIVPLLMCIFKHRKYRITDLILQVMLVTGLYLLSAKGGLNGFGIGEILGICTATLCACALVFGSDAVSRVHSQTLSILQLMSGLVISLIMGFSSGSFAKTDFSLYLQPKIVAILLFNSLIGTLLGYQLQNIALKKITSNAVGMMQSAYPVFTFIVAHILLGESLTVAGVIGAVLITACVILQSRIKE